jgi:hypothetical protein
VRCAWFKRRWSNGCCCFARLARPRAPRVPLPSRHAATSADQSFNTTVTLSLARVYAFHSCVHTAMHKRSQISTKSFPCVYTVSRIWRYAKDSEDIVVFISE